MQTEKLKIKRTVPALTAALMAAVMPVHAVQRHDDSVTSGKFKGGQAFDFKRENFENLGEQPLKSLSILSNVQMRSTYPPFQGDTIIFGPYINSSNYPLTISLHHTGGSDDRAVTGMVDDIQVVNIASTVGSISFVVPPRSKYQWATRNEFSVSASVVVSTSVKSLIPHQVGLPSAENFRNPFVLSGYLGCETQLGKAFYFYKTGTVADKSNAYWNELTQWSQTLGESYYVGEAPKNPIPPCVELPPPPSDPEPNGGGGTS